MGITTGISCCAVQACMASFSLKLAEILRATEMRKRNSLSGAPKIETSARSVAGEAWVTAVILCSLPWALSSGYVTT